MTKVKKKSLYTDEEIRQTIADVARVQSAKDPNMNVFIDTTDLPIILPREYIIVYKDAVIAGNNDMNECYALANEALMWDYNMNDTDANVVLCDECTIYVKMRK